MLSTGRWVALVVLGMVIGYSRCLSSHMKDDAPSPLGHDSWCTDRGDVLMEGHNVQVCQRLAPVQSVQIQDWKTVQDMRLLIRLGCTVEGGRTVQLPSFCPLKNWGDGK